MADEPMSLTQRCRGIQMVLLDVDGVLTDGGIIYTDGGEEIKAFHVRDGTGLKLWMRCGKRAGIITGRNSKVVARRAAELGLAPVIQGADDKLRALETILAKENLTYEQVAYVGDDLLDIPTMRRVGLGVAVGDACNEARAAAAFVTQAPGGRGAVRETIEFLLKAQGLWEQATGIYLH